MASLRAVFLDRDGVLIQAYLADNGRPLPPRTEAQFRLLPDVVDACTRLKAAGFHLICVSNQPDIARGTADSELIAWINAEVVRLCGLDKLVMCPHDDADRCDCRKPLPGMLTASAQEFGLDLSASYMVGDRFKDIDAGHAAGCRTVLIDYAYPEPPSDPFPDVVVASLAEAADFILGGGACRQPKGKNNGSFR